MIRSVMVPLDGSPFGEEALPIAEALARRWGARVHVVHVPPLAAEEEGAASGEEDEARTYLNSVTARVCEDLDESCSFAVLDPGPARTLGLAPFSRSVSEALDQYARREAIDLVIMTTHGRTGLSRAWLGGVADSFIRHSSTPVLLLRPAEGMDRSVKLARGGFQRLLVPLDGSEASEEVLAPALDLTAPNARLLLARVVAPAYDMGSPFLLGSIHLDEETTQARRAFAEEALTRVAERLRARGLAVSTHVLTAPAAAEAILELAGKEADCIAMTTRGLGAWSRLVLGSTADKVVRGATLPVLVRPPGASAGMHSAETEAAARA